MRTKLKPLTIGPVALGGRTPAFILGPCVIESEAFVRRMARKIAKICAAEKLPFIFKASYDKANRTSVRSYRGIGARQGCELLAEIGREIGMPVTTDVHSPNEAGIAAEFIDVLQIPAFLCRQTDLIRAAAETGRVVNVKKGQFLAPWDVRNIAEKLEAFGAKKFFFTERGHNLRLQQSRRRHALARLAARGRLSRHLRCHPLGPTAWRCRQRHFGRRRPRTGPRPRRACRRLRRDFHGGARKSRPRPLGWTESSSAKGFAEAFAHVKSYSCCRVVAGPAFSAGRA